MGQKRRVGTEPELLTCQRLAQECSYSPTRHLSDMAMPLVMALTHIHDHLISSSLLGTHQAPNRPPSAYSASAVGRQLRVYLSVWPYAESPRWASGCGKRYEPLRASPFQPSLHQEYRTPLRYPTRRGPGQEVALDLEALSATANLASSSTPPPFTLLGLTQRESGGRAIIV